VPPTPPSPPPSSSNNDCQEFINQLQQSYTTIISSFSELILRGFITPKELIETLGYEDLDSYLTSAQRQRIMEASLHAGRQGLAFDDLALLEIIPPSSIAAALPIQRIRQVLEILCKRAQQRSQSESASSPKIGHTQPSPGNEHIPSVHIPKAPPVPPPFPIIPEPSPEPVHLTPPPLPPSPVPIEPINVTKPTMEVAVLAPETPHSFSNPLSPFVPTTPPSIAVLVDDDEVEDAESPPSSGPDSFEMLSEEDLAPPSLPPPFPEQQENDSEEQEFVTPDSGELIPISAKFESKGKALSRTLHPVQRG
jgi:hypothetical protein